jgi:serpin B
MGLAGWISTLFGGTARQRAPDVATAINDFGFDLLRRTSESGGPNTVVSPYSVATLLAMTGNGAKGRTAAQMRRVLHSDAIGPEEAERQWTRLNAAIASRSAEQALSVASAMWAQEGLGLDPGFVAASHALFGAEVNSVDFNSTDMASVVNRWAADKTCGLIPKIVQEVDPRSLLLLINAVYFKGLWETPFIPNLTRDAAFTLPDGPVVEVAMMNRVDESIQRIETRSFVMVRLPYKGSDSAMYLVLPNAKLGLARLLHTLTGQAFIGAARLAAKTRPGEFLALQLPRLDLTWGSDNLADALSAMGMPAAFDSSKADFGGIAQRRPLFISRFVHNSRIKVGELGTEATAVSYVDMYWGMPLSVAFNRPFLFGIVDEKSGAILFLGAVNDPRVQ